MHLYIGVGYGIVKLYSLCYVHITAARAHALSNMHYAKFYEKKKKTITRHRATVKII